MRCPGCMKVSGTLRLFGEMGRQGACVPSGGVGDGAEGELEHVLEDGLGFQLGIGLLEQV